MTTDNEEWAEAGVYQLVVVMKAFCPGTYGADSSIYRGIRKFDEQCQGGHIPGKSKETDEGFLA